MVSQKKTRIRRSKDGIARQLMQSEEIGIPLEDQDVVRLEGSYSSVEIISIDTDGTYPKRVYMAVSEKCIHIMKDTSFALVLFAVYILVKKFSRSFVSKYLMIDLISNQHVYCITCR